ncbi:formylglycine-generating enzyme family protein [Yoonia sp. SS1-5]|uniref:Formylglycine-generating enzyme family protein n=1 Tax=Yoonia rhodophyticola TaxID=3137370 RepID=A0AAN0NJI2_9RHOB
MLSYSGNLGIAFAIWGLLLPAVGLADDATAFALSDGRTVTPLARFRECDVCPEMVVMPLGSFMMGAREGESWSSLWDDWGERNGAVAQDVPDGLYNVPNEGPQHRVLMDTPYATAVNEVTHAEWMVCVREGGCSHNPDHSALTFEKGHIQLGPDHPVINVSLLDIEEYVTWLNAHVGAEVYRLPTEAEWEYAARAGTTTRFAQGDVLTSDQANFSGDTTEHNRGRPFPDLVTRAIPVPVQTLDAANPWGLRHMSGNVYEITLSCHLGRHIGLPTNSAYLAHAAQGCDRYVAKGGAYNMAMDGVRLAYRTRPKNDNRDRTYGFRLVRIFPRKESP